MTSILIIRPAKQRNVRLSSSPLSNFIENQIVCCLTIVFSDVARGSYKTSVNMRILVYVYSIFITNDLSKLLDGCWMMCKAPPGQIGKYNWIPTELLQTLLVDTTFYHLDTLFDGFGWSSLVLRWGIKIDGRILKALAVQ